jgi:hypothetical protein
MNVLIMLLSRVPYPSYVEIYLSKYLPQAHTIHVFPLIRETKNSECVYTVATIST